MLNEGSWPPAVEFLDFVQVMDTEEAPEEEEETMVEEVTDSSSGPPAPADNLATHSEL